MQDLTIGELQTQFANRSIFDISQDENSMQVKKLGN